ncbi:DUF6479 family protein [Streptomyces luteolus]|uniref:DUF6479 family protein n=1 Tax=Streptomyces luteolus TaxID=3043615 RepID=A0ABT6T0Z5_9ACTN|nr:DUF6479 family protein [Streptomyces sp. B-S-A12]MDI3421511.1 DUF6479 family protein [Streptomyces sp. B-S-A12]
MLVSGLQGVVVYGVVAGMLLGLAVWGFVRRRRATPEPPAREYAATRPEEETARTELRSLARQLDRDRDELSAQGHKAEAAYRARAAVEQWQRLVAAQPGRFQGERHAALVRLSELLVETGQSEEAARVRQEAAEVAWRGSRGATLPGTPPPAYPGPGTPPPEPPPPGAGRRD